MLVLLQSDLSRQGVPTGAKGVCGSCQKPIAGKVVKALGCAWHPEHFVCARCGGELGGGSFFEKDGVPYCPRDYGRLFSPRGTPLGAMGTFCGALGEVEPSGRPWD
uniref:LIM zinc-binding domain-containing protein n=1 Tax=Calidris pygmaea TaxID=425635 RepID=A0A8C3JFG3_9CHAR